VYVIPRRTGELVVGATSEEKGFDTTVTAGAVRELLDRARELVPGVEEATFVEVAAGLRPGTPDNGPLVGRLGGAQDGVVLATGTFRHGVLLAPVVAEAVAATLGLAGASAVPQVEPFCPGRFVEVLA
jgi:glycine oxidase